MLSVEYKTPEQIKSYEATDSYFIDYQRFEGDAAYRKAQKAAFTKGEEYSPVYDYPALDYLIDDKALTDKKTAIYEAVLELGAAMEAPDANVPELLLYRQFHELRLKWIILVESARNLNKSGTSSEMEIARETFAFMNEEVFGELDVDAFTSMLTAESARLEEFTATSGLAEEVSAELRHLLRRSEVDGALETDLLNPEEMAILKEAILRRYSHVFEAMPDTPDDIYYDAKEAAAIITLALEANGLADKGWKCVVNSKKTIPATDVETKLIQLPENTRRNARELKLLALHEAEVHARRGQNGAESGMKPLENGTADYADVEEGLGVLLECILAGGFDNVPFNRARDRYITAGLAVGADNGGHARDARQVFETLWRVMAIREAKDGNIDEKLIVDSQNKAYVHVENAYRGTPFWMQGAIYLKLKVYYEGLRKNAEFFRANIHNIDEALDKAMIGKYNHTDPEEYGLIVDSLNATVEI